jgi:tetratricopeptide (TPR) repeat protein
MQAPKRAIPKFTSFKAPAPSTATAPTVAPTESAPAEDKGKEKERERSRRRRHHRSSSRSREHGHKRERRERDKSDGERRRSHRDDSRDRSHRHRGHDRWKDEARLHRSRSRESKSVIPRATAPRSPSPEPDVTRKQFFVDTKGDVGNLVYGTIHKYSIPKYRRSGAGRIVGLPSNLRIDRDEGDGKGIVLMSGNAGREDASVKTMRQLFSKLDSKDVKKLRVKKEETGLDEAFSRGLDFVPLSTTSKKRKTRDAEAPGDSEDERDHYRSIEGLKKRSAAPDDQDLDYASDSQSDGDYVAADEWGDRKRMVEFARKVEASPSDIDAWLAYVNHHDSLISVTGRRKTAAERRSTAEVKLDILQKALDKNPGNEALLLKYMDVAQEIWEPQKLLSKWKQLLEKNPTLISLWTKYINFRQTDFLSFTYPECLKCFQECLAVLRTAALNSNLAQPAREALDGVILYVFTRTVLFMNQAGYRENAIAALQAMLELNLFAPASIASPTSQREFETLLEHFETFWDSEVPRIGEDNALGWASFVASGETGDSPDAVADDLELPPLDPDDPFGSWTGAEIEWSKKTRMPARTIDDVEEDDPYRVILFSDIKEFLFYFSSEHLRKRMVEAFLTLKGMPPLDVQSSNSEAVADAFLCNGLATLGLDSSESWFWPKKQSKWDTPAITWEGMEPERKATTGDNPFEFKLRNFPVAFYNIFCKSSTWFDGTENFKSPQSGAFSFIRNTLKMLVDKLGDESIALYYLACEWANAPNG